MASLEPTILSGLITGAPDWRQHYPEVSRSMLGWTSTAPVYGVKTSSLPIVENPKNANASIEPGYSAVFYNRIHIIPTFTGLGNISNDSTVSVTVFNAYFNPVTIESVSVDGGDGTQLIDPIGSYPYQSTPLQEIEYQLEVSASVGAAQLDATINFDFNVGNYSSRVVGSRTVVFPFAIDWAGDFEESFKFLTSVTRSISGKEQRMGLNSRPRRSISFTARAFGASQASLMRSLLWGWQDRYYAVPLWPDADVVGSFVSAGAITIPVDTAHKNYFVGGSVLLYRSSSSYESLTIADLTDASITFERPVQIDWPATTKIMPLLYGHLPKQVSMSSITDDISDGKLIFSIDPETAVTGTENGSPDEVHGGLELLTRSPNWQQSMSLTSNADFMVLDYGQGLNNIVGRAPPQETNKYLFQLNGKGDIENFKQFIGRCNGRRVPFFMPTWVSDMEVASDIGASALSVVIEGNGYDRYYSNLPSVEGVFFVMSDGQSYARSITGFTVSADGSIQLDIDSAIGTLYKVSEILKASYLVRCRLTSDLVKIKYITTDIAEAQIGATWVDE